METATHAHNEERHDRDGEHVGVALPTLTGGVERDGGEDFDGRKGRSDGEQWGASQLLMPDLLRGLHARRREKGQRPFVPAREPQRRIEKPPSQAKAMVSKRLRRHRREGVSALDVPVCVKCASLYSAHISSYLKIAVLTSYCVCVL